MLLIPELPGSLLTSCTVEVVGEGARQPRPQATVHQPGTQAAAIDQASSRAATIEETRTQATAVDQAAAGACTCTAHRAQAGARRLDAALRHLLLHAAEGVGEDGEVAGEVESSGDGVEGVDEGFGVGVAVTELHRSNVRCE